MLFRIGDHRADSPDDVPGSPGPGAVAIGDAEAQQVLSNLRAVVLLAGAVRPNQLRRAVGRFLLELPVDSQRSVMDCWHQLLTDVAVQFGFPHLPVRVIVDKTTALPQNNKWSGRCEVRFEQDPFEYRGTGGLLRDISLQYGPDDYLLIVNAAQLMLEPVTGIALAMAKLGGDVVLACRNDGSPTGIMLVRCGAVRGIPELGYVDLNEQALPTIAKDYTVRVLRRVRQCGVPIRTLSDYLDAVRQFHKRAMGRVAPGDAFSEDWRATFGIIEPGAQVDPSAVVHDSVVLAGGRVEPGALLVRALVCPGGTVTEGAAAVDCLVTRGNGFHGRDRD